MLRASFRIRGVDSHDAYLGVTQQVETTPGAPFTNMV